MERNRPSEGRCRESGFSLIELLVVTGIIAVIAAVSLPAISRYLQNYKIKGATQTVANAIQEARTRAVMRNATNGVSFAVVGTTRYRIIFDDPIINGTVEAQLGTLGELPTGVEFALNPSGTLDNGVRFTRLGALQDYTFTAACKASESGKCTNTPGRGFGVDAGGTAVLRLVDTTNGLRRDITIAPGGRVLQVDAWKK